MEEVRTDCGIFFGKELLAALVKALVVHVALTLVLCFWAQIAPTRNLANKHYFYHDVERVESLLGDLCVKWDSYWYLNIAQLGYTEMVGDEANTAFPPAYPYLVRVLSWTGLSVPVAGVVLSSVCYVALLCFSFSFARYLYGPDAAANTVLLLCVFPSSWVFQMVYSEALFCAALFGFLACYQRNRHVIAGILAFSLPLTRIVGLAAGVAVALDFAFTWRRERRLPREILLSLSGFLGGLLCLCVIYWQATGSAFGFLLKSGEWSIVAQARQNLVPLAGSLWNNLHVREVQIYLPFIITYGVVTAILLLRKRDISTLFAAVYLLMLTRVSYESQLRYLLPLLTVHAGIANVFTTRRWTTVTIAVLAMVQLLITRLYLDWRFVI